jgi:hypothetical protein
MVFSCLFLIAEPDAVVFHSMGGLRYPCANIRSEYLLVQVYSDRKLLLHTLTLYIEHDMLSS